MSRPFFVGRIEMFARSRSRASSAGAEQSLLEGEARTAAVRRSDTPSDRFGRGRVGERKKQVHECTPFDCFWKGRAALPATVVVQPCKINGGVRSFFLLKKAIDAGVQEKSNQLISLVMLNVFHKMMFLKD
ncbi:hypothetical protein [Pseudomonas sp. GV085]|uniref:hypothetical protein n=1 Tax=Pseudomonas sp. GV085 TaxID=2135756 RepID=UPI0011B1D9B1|nr:hypothetical protein [Pseudomonas sp. GV085]